MWEEFSYMKKDENQIEKEFSYDLDANTWQGGYSVDFMIECKYKTEPTKWLFTPDPYSYQNDLTKNSFFHPIDHFSEHTFPFDKMAPDHDKMAPSHDKMTPGHDKMTPGHDKMAPGHDKMAADYIKMTL